ncbi:hypothetical protein CRV24_002761 [Beauveria bassiana]|nr:hypothetical protein CRV24_002761 [Beauveria bassiana]KAH8718151.1 hypothetical protein HC256_002806 [Beauveria bassiana]
MSDSSNEEFCPRYEYFGTLVAVNAAYAAHNGRVIVPSRCYYKPSKDRPLAGARFSVKDNIDVAGQKTTLCNRAWTEFISLWKRDCPDGAEHDDIAAYLETMAFVAESDLILGLKAARIPTEVEVGRSMY